MTGEVGILKKDGVADLIILEAPSEYFPIYHYAGTPIKYVIKKGLVRSRPSEEG
jgi:imidazolonepropionase-like amidohydrolase